MVIYGQDDASLTMYTYAANIRQYVEHIFNDDGFVR